MKDLIEYIKNSIDIIVSIKLDEELQKYKFNNNNPGAVSDYEKLLQNLEQDIRGHISLEHQLRIQCEKFAEKQDILEDEKKYLLTQIVRKYTYYFF